MAMANANLNRKLICSFSGKFCLILIAILHILVALGVLAVVLYLLIKTDHFEFFMNLLPCVLAFLSAFGAICLLCLKKQCCMAACVIWPLLIFLLVSLYYGAFVYKFYSEGLDWKTADNKHVYEWEGKNVPLIFIGSLLIPLAGLCLGVLCCLGCGSADEKDPREEETEENAEKRKKSKEK